MSYSYNLQKVPQQHPLKPELTFGERLYLRLEKDERIKRAKGIVSMMKDYAYTVVHLKF